MSEPPTKFRFVADPESFRPEVSHVGRIPAGVSGKDQLMRVLEETLELPDYFGRNWDPLSDCLRDLNLLEVLDARAVRNAFAMADGPLLLSIWPNSGARADQGENRWNRHENHRGGPEQRLRHDWMRPLTFRRPV